MRERLTHRTRIFLKRFLLMSLWLGTFSEVAWGIFLDNRFLDPAFDRRFFLRPREETTVEFQPFVLTADHSFDQYGHDAGLFEYGNTRYGLRNLDNALVAAGTVPQSLVRSDWQGRLTNGPYGMEGTFDAHGIVVAFFAPLTEHFGVGIRTGFLKLNSCMHLFRDNAMFESIIAGAGDEYELQELQENIHNKLGVTSLASNVYSATDTECYLKLFSVHDYSYLCRLVDASLSLGFIAPTAKKRNILNPASISAGGDGHWGLFIEGDLDAVLRQDLRAGLILRAQQRLNNTRRERMPVGEEPPIFGALIGDATVKPGLTFVMSPYLMFEHLRNGLGISIGYTLVKHLRDGWIDCRKDQDIVANLAPVSAESPWTSERIYCGIFYDMDWASRYYRFSPIISLNVDVPVAWVDGKRSAETFGVSVGVEMHF